MSTSGKKAIFAAAGANLAIAAAKFGAFAFTGSSAMLSEGIHSVADTANQVLLLGGHRHGKAGPNATHQFGRAGARYVYSFIVAVVLFCGGGLFSVYEGVHKILHPEELHSPSVALAVLAVAAVAESFSLRTAWKESKQDRGGTGLYTYLRSTKSPELPVVMLEDIGALTGLLVALVGIVLAMITHNSVFDGISALCIGVLLCAIAVFLAGKMASMLIGESAGKEVETQLRNAVGHNETFQTIIHLRTLHLGPDELLVALKVAVPSDAQAQDVAAETDAAEKRIRAAVPEAKYIFVETDLLR